MKTDPAPGTRVRFGTFEADLRSGELRRDGLKVKIQELPFQVLVLLLERRGEVVTREDLRSRLWPADTFVDFEQGLNKAINKLREALDDDANNPRFVETLTRRGYRFIAPVEAGTGSRKYRSSAARVIVVSSAMIVAIVGALVALNVAGLRNHLSGRATGSPKIHTIAVLPVANLSGDPEQEYFADGMTDELIMELSKISTLQVIGRTSVMVYKGSKRPIREIARELNVDSVIEASALRSGDRVRINSRLVYGSTERVLWEQTFERNLGDILDLSSAVAREVADRIQVTLTRDEQQRLASARPVNPQAYDAYLRGRYLWNKRTGQDMRKGIEYFQQAVKIDPNYAPAYAGIADSYDLLAFFGPLPAATAYAKAKEAALKAVALDDSLAESHASLAQVLFHYDWDWPTAEKEYRLAIALNPNYATAHHWYAAFLSLMGRHDQGLAEMKKAQRLDPLSRIINTEVGSTLFYAGKTDLAIKQLQSTRELYPDFWYIRSWLGKAYLAKGLQREGLQELESAVKLSGGNGSTLAELAYGYAVSGKPAKARQILATLEKKAKRNYVSPYDFAVVYTGLGDKDLAVMHLEKAFQERYIAMHYLNVDRHWLFRSLSSDPRFQSILRRMNFPRQRAVVAN
ncbi:MAG TPA: winged helix-turn-helix domain-containing protein [Terriglobia bacterium]|nr:winged helix-turn-helix domain-containing protein [Terriglobia bacterium]